MIEVFFFNWAKYEPTLDWPMAVEWSVDRRMASAIVSGFPDWRTVSSDAIVARSQGRSTSQSLAAQKRTPTTKRASLGPGLGFGWGGGQRVYRQLALITGEHASERERERERETRPLQRKRRPDHHRRTGDPVANHPAPGSAQTRSRVPSAVTNRSSWSAMTGLVTEKEIVIINNTHTHTHSHKAKQLRTMERFRGVDPK